MEFRKLTLDDVHFSQAMELYGESFPVYEQRTFGDHRKAMEHPEFCPAIICQDGEFIGILFYWQFEGGTYIEHFAVSPALRGQNYGSRVLAAFCRAHPDTLLEIDVPSDEISVRRQGFYERAGFLMQDFDHVHPPYRKGFAGHQLRVMTYGRDWSFAEYERFREYLRRVVMAYSQVQI